MFLPNSQQYQFWNDFILLHCRSKCYSVSTGIYYLVARVCVFNWVIRLWSLLNSTGFKFSFWKFWIHFSRPISFSVFIPLNSLHSVRANVQPLFRANRLTLPWLLLKQSLTHVMVPIFYSLLIAKLFTVLHHRRTFRGHMKWIHCENDGRLWFTKGVR